MDKKILAIAAVAVIVVAAVACVLVLNNGKHSETTSDYTLLDSEDKITAGYCYSVTMKKGESTSTYTVTVKSVKEGEATCVEETKESLKNDTDIPLSSFSLR